MLRSVCRSPSTGGTAQTRPGGSVAGAGWGRIAGQRAGAAVRADNRKRGGSHRPLPGSTSCPKRRSSDRWCGRTLGDGRDGCGAGNRATRRHCVPALIPRSVLSPFNTGAHDGGNRLGDPDSLRGRVLILTICSWRTIRSGAGNHSEMDLKTIALDARPAVAKRKEFSRGTNDGLRGESAATDTGKEYWTGTGAAADSLAERFWRTGTGRAGMKLLENRSLSESKMGDDGDRLINGGEAAVNQGWRIVLPAPGPGTNSRRINVEYR